MKKLKNKKFLISTIMTIILIIIGSVAYAYLQSQIGPGATARINVDPKTVDELKFSNCGDISLKMTQFNLTDGGSNLSDSTCAKATLRANNDTNSATQTYNVFVLIKSNDFVYSTAPTNTPEIIMTVTNPNNQAVTSINGLTYVTSGGVSGFDVTTKSGSIQIASNYSITSNSSTTPTRQTWNITFTVMNLATNQSANSGHKFNAIAVIQKDSVLEIADYWNNTSSGSSAYYTFPNKPATSYSLLSQLLSNYSTPNPDFAVYIKTTLTEHQVCMYYNSHQFCMDANFYDTSPATTLTKLQTQMTAALGVSPVECRLYDDGASCDYSSNSGLYCSAYTSGAGCISFLSGQCNICSVSPDGTARCFCD